MEIEVGLADEIAGVVPDVARHGAVGDDEAALGVLDEQVVGNLVDHRVEEGALGVQILFDALAVGDVAGNANQTDDLALVVRHRRFGGEQPFGGAGLVDTLLLHVDHRLTGCHDPLLYVEEVLRDLGWKEVEVGLANEIPGTRHAGIPRDHVVGDKEPAFGILRVDQFRDLVDDRVKQEAHAIALGYGTQLVCDIGLRSGVRLCKPIERCFVWFRRGVTLMALPILRQAFVLKPDNWNVAQSRRQSLVASEQQSARGTFRGD